MLWILISVSGHIRYVFKELSNCGRHKYDSVNFTNFDQNHGHELPPEMKTKEVGPNEFFLLDLLYWQRKGIEQFLVAIDKAAISLTKLVFYYS